MTLGNDAERSQERPEDHQKALEGLAARMSSLNSEGQYNTRTQ